MALALEMGITSARVGRSPPSHRWDHEDMLPATYSEAKELPRREWELRDLVIHVCHCTSIPSRRKLERHIVLVCQFSAPLTAREQSELRAPE